MQIKISSRNVDAAPKVHDNYYDYCIRYNYYMLYIIGIILIIILIMYCYYDLLWFIKIIIWLLRYSEIKQ